MDNIMILNTMNRGWHIVAVFIIILLHGCAEEKIRETPQQTESKIKEMQNKQLDAYSEYLDCLGNYIERFRNSTENAGDIADGAAASCQSIALAYGKYRNAADVNRVILYRRTYSAAELEKAFAIIPSIESYAREIATDARGTSVDYVLKLRMKKSP